MLVIERRLSAILPTSQDSMRYFRRDSGHQVSMVPTLVDVHDLRYVAIADNRIKEDEVDIKADDLCYGAIAKDRAALDGIHKHINGKAKSRY